ncbi:SIMPL domain-containing protein [Pseudonocardia sp. KRD291]|uniref:SIMPL domain-containing protein n=1 Tax=Pseudonocardia sp. KRD291 TaxID=2792007 RepID=UPI001C4A5CE7|nr:SIMPL domain-containing protein [Pseudonocardia sp. KRD291]MBW0106161.1 SIMPL domain-containing protein [Pseudonocardia sp. KRD291]
MPDEPEIVTEGEGHHEQLADRAELTLSYEAVGPDRSTAVAELGTRVAAAADVLAGPGVAVRSRRLWVRTEWRGKRERGCRAGERIALTITDLTVLEKVLAALLHSEPTQVDGPHWTLADPSPAARSARGHAVADARERAEGYADALGMRLGELRRLTDSGAGAPTAMRAMSAPAREPEVQDLGLEPEPVRVTARCTTTWALTATES